MDASLPQYVPFVAPAGAPAWKRWLVFSPLARIILFIAITLAIFGVLQAAVTWLGWTGKEAPAGPRAFGFFLRQVVPTLTAYFILVRLIERRQLTELAWRRVLPDGARGVAAGLLFISATVAVLWLCGSYTVTGFNPDAPWLKSLMLAGLGAAIGEEIVFRGVLFRITEDGLGTLSATALSGLLFGILHAGNANATAWSSVAIAIEAGVLLGMVFHVTRSLPLVMGLHMAWNFAQGTIYGIPVSGTTEQGWLVSQRTGPEWLSGGAFGAEASVVAVGLSVLASLALIALALRRGTFVRPWWNRAAADNGTSRQNEGTPC